MLQLCSCVHAHVILYMSVLEARISAIMKIGNFNIILSNPIRETCQRQEGIFHNIALFTLARERGAYFLTTSVSFDWTVADDMFICFIQSHS